MSRVSKLLLPWLLVGCVGGESPEPGSDGADEDVTTADAMGSDAITDDVLSDTLPEDDSTDEPDTMEPDVPSEICGDGICQDDETAEDCPVDCGGGEATTCLKTSCTPEMAACYDDDACEALLLCLIGCTDAACTQQCYVGATETGIDLMLAAVQCGQGAGCFGGPSECGNGKCNGDETAESCPEDCATECLPKNCSPALKSCNVTPGCSELYACWSACEDTECQVACYQVAPAKAIKGMQDIETCGTAAGCITVPAECGDGECTGGETQKSCPEDCTLAGPQCGDGECEAPETTASCPEDCESTTDPDCGNGECEGDEAQTCPSDCNEPTGSCEGKCGPFMAGASCQCDNQCDQFGDCCPDKAEVCDGVDPPDLCGNDTCDDGEDETSCPGDCTDLSPPECMVAGCKAAIDACAAAATCLQSLQCVSSCEGSLSCGQECGDDLTRGIADDWAAVMACADEKGCLK